MKNKLLSLILSVAMISSLSVLPASPAALAAESDAAATEVKQIHVAPGGSGTGSADSPMGSIKSAKEAVKTFKAGNPNTPVEVILHEGTYRLDETLLFNASDSGSAAAPITYKAAEGEKVEIKGSKVVDTSKIEHVTAPAILEKIPAEARSKVGMIDLGEQGFTNLSKLKDDYRNQLYQNWPPEVQLEPNEIILDGVRQTVARYPNGRDEYLQYAAVSSTGGTGGSGNAGGIFKTEDFRLMRWEDAKDAVIVGFPYADWLYERIPMKSVNVGKQEITMARNSVYGLSMRHSHRYAVTDLIEELDMPGEYYIDAEENILYYYPEKTLKDATMELTYLADNLVTFRNVQYVNFEGITFAHGRANAIFLYDSAHHVTIDNCRFDGFGRHGIYQKNQQQATVGDGRGTYSQFQNGGVTDFHVKNCVFTNIGYLGVSFFMGNRDDNIPSGTTITNNLFYDIGHTNKVGTAIQVFGVGAEIANNTVHSTGWGISYNGVEIDVHHNEIYNIMNNLNDGGAIYCGRNFINRGNTIHHNYIHGARSKSTQVVSQLSIGIYVDDRDVRQNIYQNIVVNTDRGIMANTGMFNTFRDNIIIDASLMNINVSNNGAADQATLDGIIKQGESALANEGYRRYWDEIREDLNHPLLGSPVGNTVKNNVSYMAPDGSSEWILANNNFQDNYQVGAEEFVDAANGDYRLKNSSKYAELTECLTEDFDMASVGIQPDEFTQTPIFEKRFELIHPRNGTTGVASEKVTFTWQRPLGGDRFRLVVAKDHELKDIVHDIITYETNYTLEGFENGMSYYWKVFVENESTKTYDIQLSDGVPYMFTVARKFKVDNSDLEAVIITAGVKASTMPEGDGVGQYIPGTKKALEDKIAEAEKMLKSSYTQEEKLQLFAEIDDLMNNDIYINGGYMNLGELIADADGWDIDRVNKSEINTDNKTLSIWSDDGNYTVCGYKNLTDVSRVLALNFKMKIDFGENNSKWVGMGLRGPSAIGHVFGAGNDQYYLVIKNGIIEYQRNSGGEGKVLEVVENDAIKPNEWFDVDFGVVNLGNVGQLTILKVNGEVAYQAIDTSDMQVLNKGTFQLEAAPGTRIDVAASDKNYGKEEFDALVAEYSLEMTETLCKQLESINSEKVAFVANGSKKAYFNGEVHDISVPAVGEGENMMISKELAGQIFGGTVSGSSITIASGTYQLPLDANGMINLKALATTLGMVVYYHSDMQLAFVSKSNDLHVANLAGDFNNVSLALAMYK